MLLKNLAMVVLARIPSNSPDVETVHKDFRLLFSLCNIRRPAGSFSFLILQSLLEAFGISAAAGY